MEPGAKEPGHASVIMDDVRHFKRPVDQAQPKSQDGGVFPRPHSEVLSEMKNCFALE